MIPRSNQPFLLHCGALSSHAPGTAVSLLQYISRSNAISSSIKGRKLTDAVICLMIPWISLVTSFSDFSGKTGPAGGNEMNGYFFR